MIDGYPNGEDRRDGMPRGGPGSEYQAVVRRFEEATPDELELLLTSPSIEQERALRLYLGDDRYTRMHRLALMQSVTRGAEPPRGNVVILPGLMGSALHTIDARGNDDEIWLDLWQIARGRVGRLRLAADGVLQADPSFSTRPGKVLWKYYGELVLALKRHWRVLVFGYDWRKDLRLAADGLLASINAQFGPDEPVHLVAHSMGGLVARSFIQRHPQRWRSMWAGGADRRSRGGRLVMLGTPNHGTYLVPQVLCGLANTVWKIERLDITRDMGGLLRVIHSFPGVYQLLPSPIADLDAKALYDPDTYGPLGVPGRHLESAGAFHEELAKDLESKVARQSVEDRLVYFAGYGQQTPDGIRAGKLGHLARVPQPSGFEVGDHYAFTFQGDGSVSRRLGQPRDLDGELLKVRTYKVQDEHSAMLSNANVLSAVDEVLRLGELRGTGTRGRSATAPGSLSELDWGDPAERPGIEPEHDPDAARLWAEAHEADRSRFDALLERTRLRAVASRAPGAGAGAADDEPPITPGLVEDSPEARELTEAVLSDVLYAPRAAESRPAPPPSATDQKPPRIGLHLALDCVSNVGVRRLHAEDRADVPPVDAIALGHYKGEKPRRGEPAWELDQLLGRALLPPDQRDEADSPAFEPPGPDGEPSGTLREARQVLSQMIERGVARGELGQPFFLPDPREPSRLVALCGMGVPGGFGAPELTVLVRELVWALGKLGKRHLAAAPIGTRNTNIPPAEAAEAWVRGIKLAFSGIEAGTDLALEHITFALPDPGIFPDVDRAFRDLEADLRSQGRLDISYTSLTPGRLEELGKRAAELDHEHAVDRWERRRKLWEAAETPGLDGRGDRPDPVRITVRYGPGDASGRPVFRFGAVTREAALPMREIDVDHTLVAAANDELADEFAPDQQFARGRFLGQLLLPRDFRPLLRTGGSLVMMLDAQSARIHWEMVARPELWDLPDHPGLSGVLPGESTDWTAFLGTSRGLTRQLITGFAPPPEPPPPGRRYLRVLVVADPARDAPLPGARREGVAVVELLRAFNAAWGGSGNVVEVDALIGPGEATRTNVLRRLMGRTYDAFHYAGHCYFDPKDPSGSGLLFSDGQVISAHEMRRIDRVPKFVFLNACESGIVPSDLIAGATGYRPGMAPSFAEAFFERGVSNLVCTAWPVDDQAATAFSQRLYRGLLGLDGPDADRVAPVIPLVLHRAMQEARLAIARPGTFPGGALTWGAYQHYGNPDFAFFDGSRMARGEPAVVARMASTGSTNAEAKAPAKRKRSTRSRSKARSSRAKGS
ncbi:CHAT domain-containing protein [Tautonia plasticadhaerens]|uniref:CHAT domain protein n=1 Tax=Tautonia plasticadhaerens TaxID=2527974 RepID=A0A518H1T9_9BACT|nr:CHAT domain-containing protein [Tautonia plasticadhaerens]QDV34795.1 CHAT domain protein [Tautonia plasticadhaerens]